MFYLLQTAIPENAHLEKGLQSIYGVGKSSAQLSLKMYGIMENARGKDLRRLHRLQLRTNFEGFPRLCGEDLKHVYKANCKRLIDIQSYRGRRHKYSYPVRGQRTHTNAITQRRLGKRWISESFDSKQEVINKKNKRLPQKLQKAIIKRK